MARVEPYKDAVSNGDEPVLLAQRSGVPVFAGVDRYRAGLLAEQDEELEKIVVYLLDDGFQHRRLARDIDIVFLTQEDVQDKLLPARNLPEPLRALRDADVIVLRGEAAEQVRSFVTNLVGTGKSPAIWVIPRSLRLGECG